MSAIDRNRQKSAAIDHDRRLLAGDAGSVLMEYVVVCCFIACVILLFLHNEFYNVIDGYHTRGPLKLGEGYVYFQKLRLFALSLPIP